ncbi:hypothetical protein J4E91_003186 [Alternaria rosae]|nr:hypothetical protein J4E91_003186 [Alternaria rosae]
MGGVYIPPQLRKKPATATIPDLVSKIVARPSVHRGWNPRATGRKTQERSDGDSYTIREIHNYFSGSDSKYQDIHGATLNASAENPTGLSWVLLFAGANTRWIEDGFIFARSNLDLLPAIILPHEIEPVTTGAVVKKQLNDLNKGGEAMSPTNSEATNEHHGQSPSEQPQKLAATKPLLIQPNEGVPVAHQPIAVFSQSIGPATRSFKFLGWYKIGRLQVFEPGSNDLSDMLTKKWERKSKNGTISSRWGDPKGWKDNLSCQWAAIKMDEDEGTMRSRGVPKMRRPIDHDEMTGRSGGPTVDEMFGEMKLGDGSKAVEPGDKQT